MFGSWLSQYHNKSLCYPLLIEKPLITVIKGKDGPSKLINLVVIRQADTDGGHYKGGGITMGAIMAQMDDYLYTDQ